MQFQNKYFDAPVGQLFDFEYTSVVKTTKLGSCAKCNSSTRWKNVGLDMYTCSEECASKLWELRESDPTIASNIQRFEKYKAEVTKELVYAEAASDSWKDILIIVKDQLEYVKQTIESVRENTTNYTLYIWDNGSRQDTQDYLKALSDEYEASEKKGWAVQVIRCEQNVGFIQPNCDLAALGNGEYIICLNSDTKVFLNWDRCMIGYMEANPEVAQVGYWGGHLDAECRGFGGEPGGRIDYIPGWCFCIPRKTYNELLDEGGGLFDQRALQFAYCEDADLSLRLKAKGKQIYALHASLVQHFQNKTIEEVHQEGKIDVEASFAHNHKYMLERWDDYIKTKRVLIQTS